MTPFLIVSAFVVMIIYMPEKEEFTNFKFAKFLLKQADKYLEVGSNCLNSKNRNPKSFYRFNFFPNKPNIS